MKSLVDLFIAETNTTGGSNNPPPLPTSPLCVFPTPPPPPSSTPSTPSIQSINNEFANLQLSLGNNEQYAQFEDYHTYTPMSQH